MNDSKYRKFLLTFNNPVYYGEDHEYIKSVLSGIDIISYWCMCDEINLLTDTYHTHLFILLVLPVSVRYILRKFPNAHIIYDLGSSLDCINYVKKQQIYVAPNSEINLSDTFECSLSESVEEDQKDKSPARRFRLWVVGKIRRLLTLQRKRR